MHTWVLYPTLQVDGKRSLTEQRMVELEGVSALVCSLFVSTQKQVPQGLVLVPNRIRLSKELELNEEKTE